MTTIMIKIILQIRMRSQSADRRSDGPAKMEFLVRSVDGGDDGDGGEDRCDGDDDEYIGYIDYLITLVIVMTKDGLTRMEFLVNRI